MSIEVLPALAPLPARAAEPATANPAVARCCEAWERTCQVGLASGDSPIIARMDAREAYCRAMPPLSGFQNVRDFIACVAYGMLTNVILESSATKLLYAAQVAHNTLPKRPSRRRKPEESTA